MIEKVTALSENGLCRKNNQDMVLVVHTKETGLFAIADGMGGHFRGELASQAVILSLKAWWEKIEACISAMPLLEIVSELEKEVKRIHLEIFQMYQKIGQEGGTTLCLLLVHFDSYMVMNIGDSRCYKSERKVCRQLTVDDVWENQFSETEKMEREEIMKSTFVGSLTQALGGQERLRLPICTASIERRTCFLLCSDGVYKYSGNIWLMLQLQKSWYKKNLDVTMERIRKKVYKNGARDNLSLIMLLVD